MRIKCVFYVLMKMPLLIAALWMVDLIARSRGQLNALVGLGVLDQTAVGGRSEVASGADESFWPHLCGAYFCTL
jgi:hypothetical protein